MLCIVRILLLLDISDIKQIWENSKWQREVAHELSAGAHQHVINSKCSIQYEYNTKEFIMRRLVQAKNRIRGTK